MLKKYAENQQEKTPKVSDTAPTGVACDEPRCRGEMGWVLPKKPHPELKGLYRARCLSCGWRGWV